MAIEQHKPTDTAFGVGGWGVIKQVEIVLTQLPISRVVGKW